MSAVERSGEAIVGWRVWNLVDLSREAVARLLHVSSKTYERYEKQGRLPRSLLSDVATALELEIETPDHRPLILKASPQLTEAEAEILARLDRIEKHLAEK